MGLSWSQLEQTVRHRGKLLACLHRCQPSPQTFYQLPKFPYFKPIQQIYGTVCANIWPETNSEKLIFQWKWRFFSFVLMQHHDHSILVHRNINIFIRLKFCCLLRFLLLFCQCVFSEVKSWGFRFVGTFLKVLFLFLLYFYVMKNCNPDQQNYCRRAKGRNR